MSKKSLLVTLAGVGAGVLALAAVATIVANSQSSNLDLLFRPELIQDEGEVDNYYDWECKSQEEALLKAQEMTRKTGEEGFVLLKNDNNALPIQATQKIAIFGYYAWHNNMSGGEDPATTANAVSIAVGLQNKFTNYNTEVTGKYTANGVRGDFADPATTFADIEANFATDEVAFVVIKRNSGEGNDQSRDSGAGESNRTGLSINNAEIKLIDYVNKHFSKVVIVINSANTMELGFLDPNDPHRAGDVWTDPYSNVEMKVSNIKAAFWVGGCGSQGGPALANLVTGDVNPSGHLSDLHARNLRDDPTYMNFGSFQYSNSASLNSYANKTYFVEYEEGIYSGYRYYETAGYEADQGHYQGFDYDNAVVYPFGYGMSYTTFSKELVGTPSYNASKGEFTFKVKVKNTGNVPGKEVAQIYVSAPWAEGQVEKSHILLVGFAKTQILAAGAEETLEIVVNRDYFTSYDFRGEKCYILDQGAYKFYVGDNSHDWKRINNLDSAEKGKVMWQWDLNKKMVFKAGKDGKRQTDLEVAINKEDDEVNYKFAAPTETGTGDGKIHLMSRKDFKNTFPTAPTGNDFVLSGEMALRYVGVYNVADPFNNEITEKQNVNTDKSNFTLQEMRGVDFNDPKWDYYIEQFDVETMAFMFSNAGWQETADVENGVPLSYDCDSPYGYYGHALNIGVVNKWYCSAPVVAATFNVELARELGKAFGEEAHANTYYSSAKGQGTLITGLYGYGLNGHRSAFGGRNYEYYSEDSVLAGKIAAAEAGGASEKGLICFMKHFALNEQETNRQNNGYCAWADEQTLREVYFRSWELYIKEAKMTVKYKDNGVMKEKVMPAATGMMTAYNRIGTTYAGASISLTKILRDEFGYVGSTITDAGGNRDTYMTTDFLLRRGGNLTLANNGNNGLYDKKSNTALYWLKDATKHTLYNKANSNCVDGLGSFHYGTAPWRNVMTGAWIGVGSLVAIDAIIIALIAFNVIKLPEKKKREEVGGADEF